MKLRIGEYDDANHCAYLYGKSETLERDVLIAKVTSGTILMPEVRELAEDITRAVNAHDEMVDALKGLLENSPAPKRIRNDFSYTLYREAARSILRKLETTYSTTPGRKP